MINQDSTTTTSVIVPLPQQASTKLSDTSSSSPVIVTSPSAESEPDIISLHVNPDMESSQEKIDAQVVEGNQKTEKLEPQVSTPAVDDAKVDPTNTRKHDKKGKRPTKKLKPKEEESSSTDTSDADSESESDSSSDDVKARRKKKQRPAVKRAAAKKKQKAKAKAKKSKSKKYESTSEDSSSDDSSDSDSDYDEEDRKSRRKALRAKGKKRKSRKVISSSDDSDSDSSSSSSSSDSDLEKNSKRRRTKEKGKGKRKSRRSKQAAGSSSSSDASSTEENPPPAPPNLPTEPPLTGDDIDTQVTKFSNSLKTLQLKQAAALAVAGTTKLEKPLKKNVLEFKRVDQVYDMKIRDWKLVESNTDQKDEFDCVFTVRRRLDWEGKYKETQVDIKSKVLRNALQEVFKECKSISLVEDTPRIDPHTLFHFYDEIKKYVKKTLKSKYKKAKKSKAKKELAQQIAQCKLLLSYIDEDYDATRKALKPMLKAGTITYDLVWALFKPNTIAFTPTYTNKDDPRCIKVDFSYEYESWMTGIKSCVVDGRYLEYDGKAFGLGDHQVMIQAFKGHKRITSLAAYPLKYHKDPVVSEARHQVGVKRST